MHFFCCLCVEKGNATKRTIILQGVFLYVLLFSEHELSTPPVRGHLKQEESLLFRI